MEYLVTITLLAACLVVFAFICHLVVVVRRTMVYGGRQMEFEERAEKLQRAIEAMAARIDQVAEEAASALADRERDLVDLADTCERTLTEAGQVLASLREQCERAERALSAVAALEGMADAPPAVADAPEPSGGTALEVAKPSKQSFEKRNARVIALHAQGMSQARIAARLGMSVGEVELVLGLRKQLDDAGRGG